MKNKIFLFLLLVSVSIGLNAQETRKPTFAVSPELQKNQTIKDLADKVELSSIKAETSVYGSKSSSDVAKQNLQNLYIDYVKELNNQKSLNKKDAGLVKVIDAEIALVKSKMDKAPNSK